VSVLSICTG